MLNIFSHVLICLPYILFGEMSAHACLFLNSDSLLFLLHEFTEIAISAESQFYLVTLLGMLGISTDSRPGMADRLGQ